MSFLNHFSLPYSGMKDGFHQVTFEVDRLFFKEFEYAPVKSGNLTVVLDVDKRSHHSIFTFDISGTVATNCDRCLVDIDLPLKTNQILHFKVGAQNLEDDEVVFIEDGTSTLNVAQYIYEFICLAIPLIKVYDCRSESVPPCDEAVLSKLTISDEKQNEPENIPFWNVLKDLNDN